MFHWSDLILVAVFAGLCIIFRKGLVSDGFGLDRGFAAAWMGAKHGETMSHQFAVANDAKLRWGCIGCWLLGKLVEKDHCAKTLQADGPPTAVIASYRAGALLFLLALLMWGLPWAVGRLL